MSVCAMCNNDDDNGATCGRCMSRAVHVACGEAEGLVLWAFKPDELGGAA